VIFVLDDALQTKFSSSIKFSRYRGSMPKTFTLILSTSKKHTTRLLGKSFLEICRSSLLMVTGRHVYVSLLRNLMSVSPEIYHNCLSWTSLQQGKTTGQSPPRIFEKHVYLLGSATSYIF